MNFKMETSQKFYQMREFQLCIATLIPIIN